MSNRVDVKDLEQLIHFRQQLVRFNRTLADEFKRIRVVWSEQQENWRDPQADRLDAELNELWAGIERYMAQTPDHEQYLLRLIEQLDAVRQLRI
jgi:hypothetical protein